MTCYKTVDGFKEFTQRVTASHFIVNKSLEDQASVWFEKSSGSFHNNLQFKEQESEEVVAEMPIRYLFEGMRSDGGISQLVAHGMLCFIYFAWEKKFRPALAEEAGVNVNNIKTDIIGDIRQLRHKIAHNLAYIDDKEAKSFKVLKWVAPGYLVLTSNDFKKIQLEINRMTVRID